MNQKKKLPLTSSHWGTYRARVSNGRVQELLSFEYDQDPSPIASGIIDIQDGPSRIKAPAVRKSWLENGPGSKTDLRGVDPFVEVSWSEAEKLVAGELNRVRNEYGNSAIYAGSYGWSSAGRFHHAQSQLHRFLNCIGGYTKSKFTYSFAAAETMIPHILGSYREFLDTCTSWESILENTELFVCFGGIPLKNGQISQGGVGSHYQRENLIAATKSSISFVNISPVKADLLENVGGEWLSPRPNTDTALLLGIAYTLHEHGLTDSAFLKKYTEGYEKFLAYVLGEIDGIPKTANWASNICELDAEKIKDLAKKMAANRTMISVSWSLTRQDHGEQPFWMAITVAAMLGQIGLPGGGIGFGYSATNFIGGQFTIPPAVALPQGKNPVRSFIPVARISDLLLCPNEKFDFDGKAYTYPDTKIVYWAGGNPFHHHQDLGRLMQAWQKPDTIICNEWCWNSLAKRSDIVLPCSTPLEREDVALTPRDPYVVKMSKLTEPYGESKSDFEIFKGIACAMGVETEFTAEKNSDDWIKWLYMETRKNAVTLGLEMPSYEEFDDKGWFKFSDPKEKIVMLEDFRKDPIKNRLKTPSGRIEIYSEVVANFGYQDCPGHAVWREPCEWLGNNQTKFPLHLISNQPDNKLHSQLDHGSYSRASKIDGREPIRINSLDATKRNLKPNDLVLVFNDRGSCLAAVVVDDGIRSGVALMSTGAWYDPLDPSIVNSTCKNGNPNVLTPDKGTSSLAQGPIAHTCLVEIKLVNEPMPKVTAYDPPKIVRKDG
ncbi:MAG: molybdopterin-dependent oxidoreductase [Paracoccaceae bacterium]|nr:molybdopterin-dependent oxidoreductase [Paracoccaceae bacterium]